MNFLKRMLAWLDSLLDTSEAERRAQEAYLSECTSIVDLENRMRSWDQKKAQRPHLFSPI